ncbi:MAG TPA: DUF4390 domain-containing protein [Candidatus Polarisedimenticolia bacterium]|nr:DUF4390 domain-containing protein [Candidatus Polarisedimenticolia bacterium]
MRRILPGLVSLLLLPVPALAQAPARAPEETPTAPRIGDLKVEIREGQILASFRLDGALDDETRARIASGLETEFEYRLEIIKPRRLWVDGKMAQHRLITGVKYDSLSRQYGLTLKRDGKVERSSTTDRKEEMERWLTFLGDIPLGAAAEYIPPGDYAVRVRAEFPMRFLLYFIPWDQDTSWEKAALPAPPLGEHDRE